MIIKSLTEKDMKLKIDSEIGILDAVIIHTPGPEVENMTPKNAERALYSDILNLSVAGEEYSQFSGVLKKVSRTYEVKDLLTESIADTGARTSLLKKVSHGDNQLLKRLDALDNSSLASALIEGLPIERNNLTKFLSKDRFELRPLHNFFFTRDASVVIGESVLIGRMASKVRQREADIMNTIFSYHKDLKTRILNPEYLPGNCSACTFEGGDILIARDDIMLVGNGVRTSTEGIDRLIEESTKFTDGRFHIIVQELPQSPESFIHLDMVFTMLDRNLYMAFDPIIHKSNKYQTVKITIENKKVVSIREVDNIPSALRSLGMDLDAAVCGSSKDIWVQEREQWHSGANFFALAPGKLIGYIRNSHTLDELSARGFEIIKAREFIENKVNINDYDRCIIGIEGSELARGGGGARCMTMPLIRQAVNW